MDSTLGVKDPGSSHGFLILKRLAQNLKTLAALRREHSIHDKHVQDLSSKLQAVHPADDSKAASLKHEINTNQKYEDKIRYKVREIKEDMRTLEKLGVLENKNSLENRELLKAKRDFEALKRDNPFSTPESPRSPLKRTTPLAFQQIPLGSAVAAKMLDSDDPYKDWILATVVRYYRGRNKYEVEDAEADENDGVKQKYTLSPQYVIKLPLESEFSYNNEFPSGHKVLAIYPNTSCFYKAKIVNSPSKNRKIANLPYEYTLCFYDDNDVIRIVPWHMVIDMPPVEKQREKSLP